MLHQACNLCQQVIGKHVQQPLQAACITRQHRSLSICSDLQAGAAIQDSIDTRTSLVISPRTLSADDAVNKLRALPEDLDTVPFTYHKRQLRFPKGVHCHVHIFVRLAMHVLQKGMLEQLVYALLYRFAEMSQQSDAGRDLPRYHWKDHWQHKIVGCCNCYILQSCPGTKGCYEQWHCKQNTITGCRFMRSQ